MYEGKLVFAQLMDHLPMHTFRRSVARFNGDRSVKSFTCQDQLRCMAFAQLTLRESLRDTVICLKAQAAKLYHMGLRGHVARSTLADANEGRDWRLYATFAQALIAQARKLYAGEPFGAELEGTAYALDTTNIELCLSLFPWAEFKRTKGAVKAAHAARPARQHPDLPPHRRRQVLRQRHPGRDRARGRRHLRDGPRLRRLRPAVSARAGGGVLRGQVQDQRQVAAHRFAPGRQDDRDARPIRPSGWPRPSRGRAIPTGCAA